MMERTNQVDGNCPVCGNTMVVSRLSCGSCGSALEGTFLLRERNTARRDSEGRFGRLARLDGMQLEFVEVFLRCRGIIKNVEDILGISYPTVKARLANVLETMGIGPEEVAPVVDNRRLRREILAELAAGRISTDEALQILSQDAPTREQKSDS